MKPVRLGPGRYAIQTRDGCVAVVVRRFANDWRVISHGREHGPFYLLRDARSAIESGDLWRK